ncbi:MAG TPA: alpha-glucan family phosphorylase [Saprospiraceae bacterium]|nr:alpha-glucan family phosphorylase [Saprospiraceae bacterium]HMP23809.1 alpha-glucan family phosphorylase [Saprospiraceae bacterium]
MAKQRTSLPRVAYFCMEYGLDNAFKAYAGGLGILAGDYMKGAKDHEFPIVGLGIKWKQGYTDQMIDKNGQPYDTYHNYNYNDVMEDTGVTVNVTIRKRKVACKVWKLTAYGNADLYLLDTDLPENEDAWITGQLYGWFGEERIAQEIVLGVGGVRALRLLGIPIEVYHFNEGHALFAGFELMREKMEQGATFEEAWERSKQEIVFTTHTPVIQGNESHPIDRLLYMGADLGVLTKGNLKTLGGEPFNMTVGALRLSKKSNAVAQLHGETANKMWKKVKNRSEIVAITNAIHLPTWVDPNMIATAEKGGDLWAAHLKNKQALVDYVKQHTGQQLNVDNLIIGFARRAVPYKRSDLIFSKPEIIDPLLRDGKIQIVFSGRAHPLDDTGKGIAANLVAMAKKYPNAVVFLENYSMEIGAALTRGSDVWLNNPRRPKEASGTSGMKAAMNGVLNVSILDGWWPEACQHGVNGWQFGDGFESEDEAILDAHDRDALYQVLLEEVLPTYYNNRPKWVEMMKTSILSTKEPFAVKRMLEEYYEQLYTA